MTRLIAAVLAVLLAAPSFAAAPIADMLQLPTDAGNSGKKMRTQTRVVGANTVHEQFVIPTSLRSRLGVYFFHSGTLTIPAAAQNGTSTGHLWYQNPVGSSVKCAIRRTMTKQQFLVTSAVDVSVPRTGFSLFTFTGTASGATLTAAKRDSTDAANVCTMRTAVTGMTVTLGATIQAHFPPINATATSATIQGNFEPVVGQEWAPSEDEMIVLRPGEGVVVWAMDAGTTGNRRLITDFVTEEYE